MALVVFAGVEAGVSAVGAAAFFLGAILDRWRGECRQLVLLLPEDVMFVSCGVRCCFGLAGEAASMHFRSYCFQKRHAAPTDTPPVDEWARGSTASLFDWLSLTGY